jgi:hypothetical protein
MSAVEAQRKWTAEQASFRVSAVAANRPDGVINFRPATAALQICLPSQGASKINPPPPITLKRDDFSSNRHHALAHCLSMIFSENRYPLFGIML